MQLRLLLALSVLSWSVNAQMHSQDQQKTPSGHYLFAWTGDAANQRAGCSANCGAEGPEGYGRDFLAVIDADPSSSSYGHLVTTVATDQQTMYVHHTEYTMPTSGMLFANDHEAGRTFIFDVRDPQHPTIETSFTDMAGYMHPHSFVRLPNGHVLATFQHAHHSSKILQDRRAWEAGLCCRVVQSSQSQKRHRSEPVLWSRDVADSRLCDPKQTRHSKATTILHRLRILTNIAGTAL